jgi:xanthine dehydrogenase accessory factor
MSELFSHCLRELEAGRSVVRAVIVKTWGSTPREAGAVMVVDQGGGLKGTVGGGCGEAEVYELAQQMLHGLQRHNAALLHVDLTEDPEEGGGKVCGGRFDVLLLRLVPGRHLCLVTRAVSGIDKNQQMQWVTSLKERPGFWRDSSEPYRCFSSEVSLESLEGVEESSLEIGEQTVFKEPLGLVRRLIIVGAGHIARPLCVMASLADYLVVVLDDRPEYADQRWFPDARLVVCGSYGDHLPELARGPLTSAVLVTRGHRHDQECLRLIARYPLEYLGMIGSQRRIDAVFQELVEEGVPVEVLERVRAPIGLDIGARSPAEIACCILAEMIWRRRRSPEIGRSVRPRERHLRALS